MHLTNPIHRPFLMPKKSIYVVCLVDEVCKSFPVDYQFQISPLLKYPFLMYFRISKSVTLFVQQYPEHAENANILYIIIIRFLAHILVHYK